ncbi:hypothetical protein Calag_1454 [Caldisphaera lagunensis DSM 15908]|uniref:DUF302 domain-containing protein n=1 Tax=Caldisphaera lagunensis (strain DSM 15908 / JCM 11604 / ANMR 0165 / IC-154) TaxID=1056495 RepID=L0AB89_CALLD|nr:DUF302 domain-containing protein [Caldisphaera lagunensis]AFZ71158.1 hypothetical protein Calag_1454 [Caldisphaera lagunensis DSM 15908]
MIITYKSKYDFNELKIKLESSIIKKGMRIFSIIDHSKNAVSVGMKMNRSLLYIFGNPRNGTLLMYKDMRIGIILPLKILIWEDENKNLLISYFTIYETLKSFKLKDEELEIAKNIDINIIDILKDLGNEVDKLL